MVEGKEISSIQNQKKIKNKGKRKNPKNRKGKSKKIEKKSQKKYKESKKKYSSFPVVLDKMCVFCLYPIPDFQQYVKRGSCRRPILSGLFCFV